MTPEELKKRIETLAPQTDAQIMDLTGSEDHYRAVIVSPAFEGQSMMKQHRMVFDILKPELDSGEIHALTLKTYTPEAYKNLT